MPENERPIALDAYTKLAEPFAAVITTKAENAYIEQPAMRAALGDVRGLDVLDAGCGPGVLVEYLLNQGARVTGFDVTPRMIELARERNGDRATLFVGDMAQPLALPDTLFDVIASSLAIDYVRDWRGPLAVFMRLLRPGGRFVFSVQHPMGSFAWYKPPTPFGMHYVEAEWRWEGLDPVVVPDYYRSFEEIVNPVLASGFVLERVIETQPIEALREVDPVRYEKYTHKATFMVLCTRKPV
ncbi:hypothetical protein AYO38_05795 [bacterium SCGC AG-212-C10]|nr:hypothetical protein AYO38_05795 [bacterium SCGC AG-212-C10]